MVAPPSDASKAATGRAAPTREAGIPAQPDSQPRRSAAPAASALDRAAIRPLDLAGAMRILIAEVRAELTRALLQATDIDISTTTAAVPFNAAPAAELDAVPAAARDMLESALNSLPENSDEVALWSEAVPAVDAAVGLGLARAVAIIEAWRDVPAPIVAEAREARALVVQAWSDEPLNPFLLLPDGANLGPRLTRLRRRRKLLQRRLTDPDFQPSFFDDPEPLT